MSKLINEGLCKQLIKEYYRRINSDEPQKVVLRELMQTTFSQGYEAAIQQEGWKL